MKLEDIKPKAGIEIVLYSEDEDPDTNTTSLISVATPKGIILIGKTENESERKVIKWKQDLKFTLTSEICIEWIACIIDWNLQKDTVIYKRKKVYTKADIAEMLNIPYDELEIIDD